MGMPLPYDFVDNRVVLQWEKLDTPIDVQNSTNRVSISTATVILLEQVCISPYAVFTLMPTLFASLLPVPEPEPRAFILHHAKSA